MWAPNGRELFYRDDDKMMAAAVTLAPTFTVGKPQVLFEGSYEMGLVPGMVNYDIARDGRRFLMVKSERPSAPTRLKVVLNWSEELEAPRADEVTGARQSLNLVLAGLLLKSREMPSDPVRTMSRQSGVTRQPTNLVFAQQVDDRLAIATTRGPHGLHQSSMALSRSLPQVLPGHQ